MNKKMTNPELTNFLENVARSESYSSADNTARGFNKGVRATLIALEYDVEWVETTFRDIYERFVAMAGFNNRHTE